MNNFSPLTINLASQPFRRERAQNAALALICAGLTCCLVVLVSLIVHSRAEAADLRKAIGAENTSLSQLRREQTQFSTVLAKPENADVFARSVFLNELIARRGVSWTRVFKDLGTVMPANMRLMGVRLPLVTASDSSAVNHLQLDMLVASDRADVVIELLKNLQKSRLFGAAEVTSQSPPTQNDPLFKFRVTVPYAQEL